MVLCLMGLVTMSTALMIEIGITRLRRRGFRYHEDGLRHLRGVIYPLLLAAMLLTGLQCRRQALAEEQCRNRCEAALSDRIIECGRQHPELGDRSWVECVYNNQKTERLCASVCKGD